MKSFFLSIVVGISSLAIASPLEVKQIASGEESTCVLIQGGRVKCWGRNDYGQLGLGHSKNLFSTPELAPSGFPDLDLGSDGKVVKLASAFFNTCALFDNGKIKCWGGNGKGQLGVGHKNDIGGHPGEMGNNLKAVDLGTGQKAIDIDADFYHSCAILESGKIKCWGYNGYGQLGLGKEDNSIGTKPTDMGDNLPFPDLGTAERVKQLALGNDSTCVLFESGQMKCWGGNQVPRPFWGLQPEHMGKKLPYFELGKGINITQVVSGDTHHCLLTDTGKVKCWGNNYYCAVGVGKNTHMIPSSPAELESIPYVDLGKSERAISLTASAGYTCALLDGGKVKCWGINRSGQLGLGHTRNIGCSPDEMGDNLPYVDLDLPVKNIWASHSFNVEGHTCALLINNGIRCWGTNYFGQLGLTHKEDLGADPSHMGPFLPFLELGRY